MEIPKIGVSAEIEAVGLDKEKKMDVPKDVDNVAWFQLGVPPGAKGNAVMAGHLDTVTGDPAVFYKLDDLEAGDEVSVIDNLGKTLIFKVTKKEAFPYNQFPITRVFGSSDQVRLNLITCEGTFDRQVRNYSDRLVVFTELSS